MLSAVAGGGLTAAGLGGSLAGVAVAAPALPPVSTEGSTTVQATTPAAATSEAAATTPQPSTTTSTTPVTTTAPSTATAPTSTATVPQPSAPSVASPPAEGPKVVLQRRQKATTGAKASANATSTTEGAEKKKGKASGPSNVASSPQSIAQAGALAAILASSEASAQALAFYRIPLFLLPIYKAAAVQYGVPWQILAAINEIETNYGTDLSVSTAGAVGWMQFMPTTWLQYGVDALNAGYADPYNPVDAIFAAARYLRAAGAATDLRSAILAYNHSEEYADSVLLRAKLISTYPKDVIATLTGLIDGRLPVTGRQVAWGPLPAPAPSASSATANATAVPGQAAGSSAEASGSTSDSAGAPGEAAIPSSGSTGAAGTVAGAASAATSAQGSTVAPSPSAAAAGATPGAALAAQQGLQLVDLTSARNASVVAVQNGKIVKIGASRKLGKYLVLRDVYGDVFTYAGLGSIAQTYTLPKESGPPAKSPAVEAASRPDPQPTLPASAGTQTPLTLSVKSPLQPRPPLNPAAGGSVQLAGSEEATSATSSKVRLFAHPGNPDARAAAAADALSAARRKRAELRIPLRSGSVVATGTVLGRVLAGAHEGHMRFAIRPAGDPSTIDPGPILSNWAQLQAALHPQGATAANPLLGATASDVFLLSKAQLQRAVLSDPAITIPRCARGDVASGAIDKRVLAVLAFLSRSGLKPTVSALRCGQAGLSEPAAQSAAYEGDAVDISAVNGTPIANHQGTGTITDLTIRTLLTLPAGFVPHEIISLMHYPEAPSTHAQSTHWNDIELVFHPAPATVLPKPAVAAAHSAHAGRTAPSPLVTTVALSAAQWNQLMTRVAALQIPTVAAKPSSAAIPDGKPRQTHASG
jgi:membrane-bound lytic murein transglycosylase B